MQRKILSKTLWAENLHERRAAYTFAAATDHSHTACQRLNTEEKVIEDKCSKTPMQQLYYDSCIYEQRLTPLAATLAPHATTNIIGYNIATLEFVYLHIWEAKTMYYGDYKYG